MTENPLGVPPQTHRLLLGVEPLPEDPVCIDEVLPATGADPAGEPEVWLCPAVEFASVSYCHLTQAPGRHVITINAKIMAASK